MHLCTDQFAFIHEKSRQKSRDSCRFLFIFNFKDIFVSYNMLYLFLKCVCLIGTFLICLIKFCFVLNLSEFVCESMGASGTCFVCL